MGETSRDGSHLIDSGGNFFRTLENCEGFYECPVGPNGELLGPVVGYTAPYEVGKNWVGLTYLNFAKADPWSAVLAEFAGEMVRRLNKRSFKPDLVLGAPWAGLKFSQEVAHGLGCRHIFGEKQGDGVVLGRYEGEIRPGDRVLIGEELVNNASTTGKLAEIVESAGGHVDGVICAINRSSPFRTHLELPGGRTVPVVGVIEKEYPQYRQDDPVVAGDLAKGNFVPKPKYAWKKLKEAMDRARGS